MYPNLRESRIQARETAKLKSHKIDTIENEISELEHIYGAVKRIILQKGRRFPLMRSMQVSPSRNTPTFRFY